MGQIRSRQFLGKLFAAYAQENVSLFLRLASIIRLFRPSLNVYNFKIFATALEKIPDMYFASTFDFFFEAMLFLILIQNKGSAFQNSLSRRSLY